jgi:DnaJ-domain-containing protein 1
MKSQFHVDRGSGLATDENHETIPAIEPSRRENSWEFVDDIQRLLGDEAEPDPLFFVESWTYGMFVAVENWQKRRQGQTSRENQRRVLPEFGSLEAQTIVQQSGARQESATSGRTDANTGHFSTGWSQHSFEKSSPQIGAMQEWEPFAAEGGDSHGASYPMSRVYACKLLGVAENSTPRQIKAAYRRVANQIHPDRLELRTEGVRRFANDQMAEINEAYRMLCSGPS